MGLSALKAALGAFESPGPHARKLAVMLFHDCWMATAELAWQLQSTASCVVASQTMIPDKAWPYGTLFDAIISAQDDRERAKTLAITLARFHNDARRDRPFSALSLTGVPLVNEHFVNFVRAVKGWDKSRRTEAFVGAYCNASVGDANRGAFLYENTGLVDLLTLCDRLAPTEPSAGELAASLRAHLIVHVEDTTPEGLMPHTKYSGLSLFYAPPRRGGVVLYDGDNALPENVETVVPFVEKLSYVDLKIARTFYPPDPSSTWPDIAFEHPPH